MKTIYLPLKEFKQSNSSYNREHYELLEFISKTNSFLSIIDAGTFMGLSAIKLASNATNKVSTYDISDAHLFPQLKEGKFPNITFYLKSIADESDDVIKKSDVIFLDIDPHDGLQEQVFSHRLEKIGYQGMVIADDIWLNQGMINWWIGLQGIKIDLTTFGHFSGTGIWIPMSSTTKLEIS